MDFGKVLGGFWKTKIDDFRIFFGVFSKHFSNNFLEGQKIQKKSPTRQQGTHFGSARRNAQPAGEGNGRGSEALRCSRYRKMLGYSRI